MIDKIEYTKFNNDIWKDSNIKGYEKLVLIYLISYHNKNYNYSFPTRKNISEGTGIGNNALSNALNSLEEKGYIKRDKHKTKGGWNNIYYIHKYLVVQNNNESLSEPPQDDLNNNTTNSSSGETESLTEPSTNELLLSKSKKFDGKLTAEQRTQLNRLDTDRLMKAIERAEQTGKYETYTFGYLIAIYNKPVEVKENKEAQPKVVTKYHNSFNEHYKKYSPDELEKKLLKSQNRLSYASSL